MGNANVRPHPKPRNKKQVRWKAADRPSPPGKPLLVQENGVIPDVIHICWPPPAKDGGSPITAYLVEHRRVGSPHWLNSNPTPVLTRELSVKDLEAGWRYQFRVRAENAVGLSDPSEISEPFTVSLQRSVITPPKFTQELQDAVILEFGKVEFQVHFLAQPIANICWFKDGFEIFSSNRIRISTVLDKSILTIFQSTADDEGEIKCTATNRAGHASTKAKLTIESTPSIRLPRSYQDQDGIIFEIGELIRLNVSVSGRPTPLVFWSHDGESIQNDERHELEYIDKTASVKIENALRTDRGEYQIRAVNKLGQDMASFLVTITDKPTPPGRARVILTSGRSVTLSWSIPADDGGCKIGNYIIEYYKVGWNVWLKAATSRQLTTMLGDLIEGSQYKFRVKAESPYGVSEPSEESEVVFIQDPKRGILGPSDIVKQTENQSGMTFNVLRRRANSSPRVSFALKEEAPIRPERKKTGKTPEASPRMKRRQIPSLSNHRNNVSPKNSVKLGSTRGSPISNVMSEKISPRIFRKEFSKSSSNSPTSPLTPRDGFTFPKVSSNRNLSKPSDKPKTKSPSPEADKKSIINTKTEKLDPQDMKKSPVMRKRSFSESDRHENGKSLDANYTRTVELTNEYTLSQNNRMRPPLTRQDFSGSSEFMLVLCPEGEQGAQLKKLGISFDENGVPPPLSLSAPELGIEPPEYPSLKRSASSTELLNYRFMERLNEAALEEEEIAEMKRNEIIYNEKKTNLGIPMIQVNSQPTEELVGLERRPSLHRRLSSGIIRSQQTKWSHRRQSLKGANEMNHEATPKLHKFQATEESKKELMDYRQRRGSEDKQGSPINHDNSQPNIAGMNEDWLEDYEESIPSEEETESSVDERRNSNPSPPHYSIVEDEEEIYNPRSKVMSNTKIDNEKPFEILTIRKEPPDSSIVPRPILKKTSPIRSDNKTIPVLDNQNSTLGNPFFQRSRSRSLIETSDDPRALAVKQYGNNSQIYQRERSSSLTGMEDDLIDVNALKKSPNLAKRRSFSLIPSQANFIKDAFKNKNKKDLSPPSKKVNPFMNVAALATSTSIAGAGLVINDNINENKNTEEAKVVVDFYGDIVKSFGAKNKPTAEYSTTFVSKYDTYEQRKISEIKPAVVDTVTQESQRVQNVAVDNLAAREAINQNDKRDIYSSITKDSSYTTNQLLQQKPQIKPTDLPVKSYGNISPDFPKKTEANNNTVYTRSPSKSPMRTSYSGRIFDVNRAPSPVTRIFDKKPVLQQHKNERPQSRSSSVNRRKKVPRSRDASTSPVRFENWESRSSSRSSLEREYYGRASLNSSRASSLTRRSLSPSRPKLREITTQTSFRIESKTPADLLKKQEELVIKAEQRVKGVFEYFTDLAMVVVACWLYLFQNEFLAIPVLLILVFRQLSEEIAKWKDGIRKRIPQFIAKRFKKTNEEGR